MDQVVGQMPERIRRQRRVLLWMPVIVVPLLVLTFHALGGGKGVGGDPSAKVVKGLNMSLPDARLDAKRKGLGNKLGAYKQADKDSIRLMESRRGDPYYTGGVPAAGQGNAGSGLAIWRRDTGWMNGRAGAGRADGWKVMGGADGQGLGWKPGGPGGNAQADELLQKLDRLKSVLARQEAGAAGTGGIGMNGPGPAASLPGERGSYPVGTVERLPGGVIAGDGMGTPGSAGKGDPDLDKLDGLLDKILRIQHPGEVRAADTVGPGREERPAAVLTAPQKEETIRTLADKASKPGPGVRSDSVEQDPGSGFMSIDGGAQDLAPDNTVEAVVAEDQTLVSGETVELRLIQEAVVGGVMVPAGTLVSGKATLSGERLLITVISIRTGKQVVPVSLEVLDLDGMAGIREPGSINRDVAKASADEAVSSLGATTSLDPSWQGQTTAAGLQAMKTLMSRKVRLVRVSLKAGYKVLLRNTKVNH